MPERSGTAVPTLTLQQLISARRYASTLAVDAPDTTIRFWAGPACPDVPERPTLHRRGCPHATEEVDAPVASITAVARQYRWSPPCCQAPVAAACPQTVAWCDAVREVRDVYDALLAPPRGDDPEETPATIATWEAYLEASEALVLLELDQLAPKLRAQLTDVADELRRRTTQLHELLMADPCRMHDHTVWCPDAPHVDALTLTSADPLSKLVSRNRGAQMLWGSRQLVGIAQDPQTTVLIVDPEGAYYTSRVVREFPARPLNDRFTQVQVPQRLAAWWTDPQHRCSRFMLPPDGTPPAAVLDLAATLWQDRYAVRYDDLTSDASLTGAFDDAARLSLQPV